MERFKVKFNFQYPKSEVRKGIILSVLCLLFISCATIKILPEGKSIPEERTIKDKYSRTYSMDFSSFHPRMNSTLQEYAQKHKGNSFRVVRLGSDGVMIRGYFKSEKNQERFSTEMAVKPAGQKKTILEIKLSTSHPQWAPDFLEKTYQDLFQIIEQGTGVAPQG